MVSAEFLKNVQKDPRFAPCFKRAAEDYEYLKNNFADSPDYISGWFHNFCCPHCAAQLAPDLDIQKHSFEGGNVYHCAACGKDIEGNETLDEAWVYAYRTRLSEALPAASLYALLGDGEALDFVVRFVDFYAERYHLFPVHGKHAGVGKIMEQSLDEGVFMLAVLRALFPLRDEIGVKKREEWKEKLFLPMSRFLLEQTDFHQIHNIALWMRAAVGAMALFIGDKALLSEALDPPYGIYAQVAAGYTADGVWDECSFHYHYYSTEALTEFMLHYKGVAEDDPLLSMLEKAYTAPAAFSYDGFAVPSLSDGWYPLSLGNYAPQILTAAEILRTPALLRQVASIKKRDAENLLSVNALLYAGEILAQTEPLTLSAQTACALFEDTRLAVLEVPFKVIFRAGICRASHMHDDYLSLVLPGISDDLGTPGYGHPMTDAYYRRSFSHNTLCADERSQPHVFRDTAIALAEGGVTGEAKELWEGIDASRTLTAENGVLHDRMTVRSADTHTYDWFFHVQGELLDAEALTGEPARLAYPHITSARSCGEAMGRRLVFKSALGLLTVNIVSEAELIVAKSASNPAHILRETVILRVKASEAQFNVNYSLQ